MRLVLCALLVGGCSNDFSVSGKLDENKGASEPPVARDDALFVAAGLSETVDVLGNDEDPDSELSYADVTIALGPSHGDATVLADAIAYAHDGGRSGTDSLVYQVCDEAEHCVTATVEVEIDQVVDDTEPPVAKDDTLTLDEGAAADVDVLANDSDADSALNYGDVTVSIAPSHGTAAVKASAITYTHDGTDTTADAFVYELCDDTACATATVTVTVNPVDAAPVAMDDTLTVANGDTDVVDVLANDTDADSTLLYADVTVTGAATNGTAVVGASAITYTHDGSATTSDSFTYQVCDGTSCDTATVMVTVQDPPPVDDCDNTSDLVYVIDRAQEALYTFDPSNQSFTLLGALDCTIFGDPESMAVSRDGYAYVRYSDEVVYVVDLTNLDCTDSGYTSTVGSFGMGYATDMASGWQETMFVANSSNLYTLGTGPWGTSLVGSMPSQSELTGNAAGELWAFLPLENPARLSQLDKQTGVVVQSFPMAGFPNPGGLDTFAFATWGGEFWLFVREYGLGNTTDIYKVTATGTLSLVVADSGRDVVGAGVSTCAPSN